MAKRRFEDYQNLGGGNVRYALDGVQSVDSIAIEDPLGVVGPVELTDASYTLNSKDGDAPYDSVVVQIGERYFPVLVVTGDWKASGKE